MKPAVVVPCVKAQTARQVLERHGLWDKTRKLQKYQDDHVLIPVNTSDLALLSPHLPESANSITVIQADLPASKSERLMTPAQQLFVAVERLLKSCDGLSSSREKLMGEVPDHWEKHGDLALLPASAFSSEAEWDLLGQELWQTVAQCTGASRVARQSVVSTDGFRTPQVQLLLGAHAVVQHCDNAIKYEYDLTRCMFSAGNISEKLRIAGFNCAGETVVDLYAGIGYFTLPYLVHAGASHVHACEWNPDAVAALRRNLQLNHVEKGCCTVYAGDNRQLELKGIADRVNLGLIPSSEEGWPVACRVLKPTGGILHIHGNVNTWTAEGERHPMYQSSDTSPAIAHSCHHQLPPPSSDGDLAAGGAQQEREPQAVSSPERSGKDVSRMHTSLIQERNREASEIAACLNWCADSKCPQRVGENSRTASVLEESHSESYTTEEERLFQTSLRMSDNTVSDARSLSCPENQNHPCGKCDACSSSHLQKHAGPDFSGMRPTPGPHSEEKSMNKTPPKTQGPSDGPGNSKASWLCSKTAAWLRWGNSICQRLEALLQKEHGGSWRVSVLHIENVKSYAPHVSHLVVDIRCTPDTSASQ